MGRFLDEPQKTYKGKFLDELSVDVGGKFLDEEPKQSASLISNVQKNISSPKTRPLSPIGLGEVVTNPLMNIPRLGLSAAGVPEEDIYPMVGQAVGGIKGGFGGAVGGAVAGQGLRQAAKGLIRKEETKTISALGKEALVTGAIEGVTRGTGKILFRNQLANQAMQKLGQQIGKMKEAMSSNPNLRVSSKPILDELKVAFDDLEAPLRKGKTASVLREWISFLEKNPNPSAKNLIRMEEQLGKAAKFGEYTKGAFQPAVDIANPQANRIAKAGRSRVSGIVDELAEKGGQKGFKEASQKMSKMIEKFPEFDPSKQVGGFGQRLVTSAGVTAATGNPALGIANYLLMRAGQSPQFRNAAFKLVENPTSVNVGRALRLMASQAGRQDS